MATFKKKFETGFEILGRWIFRNRLKTLALLAAFLVGMFSQLPNITFDTSTESFFHKTDPALIDYNEFRDQFGRDEIVIISVHPPNVFETGFLEKLKALHEALENEVPHLKEVNSLINARDTRGEGNTLIVEDLLKEIPRTPESLAALKKRVLGSELYPNLLISEDGRFTTVMVETLAFSQEEQGENELGEFVEDKEAGEQEEEFSLPLTDAENTAVIRAVEKVLQRFEAPDFPVNLAGSPVVTDSLKRAMQENMGRFMALALAAIAVFLFVLFRRISGVILPILVVLFSLFSTVGAMALTGVAFTLPLMILPSFLLAVGVGASVHLLAIFYRQFEKNGDKEEAIVHALGHSGLPILMTSLTTAAGLLSFTTAALAPVGDLGIFAGLGVMISLVNTLVLLPALLSLFPIRPKSRWAKSEGSPWTDRILLWLGDFAIRRARWVILLFSLIVLLAAAGLPSLQFSHNTLVWFPKSSTLRKSTDLIDRELKGSLSIEVIVDTGKENGLYEPEMLNRMESLAEYALAYRNERGEKFVGKTSSLTDVLKEIHRALNENRQDHYVIPQNRTLIAQELLLFENSGSDDLERFVDSIFSKARITIKTPWDDAAAYVRFVQQIQQEGEKQFGEDARITTTGLLKLLTQSFLALMQSMVTSYTIAVVVITILMILLIGRFRLGLLSMIPNLLPVFCILGFMGWVGFPLDAFTLLIGSISLGLAVDDTIHFFHNYLKYYQSSGDIRQAVQETLLTTGRAMLFTTLVLVTGFWLFMFASLNNLFNFGLLTGLTLIMALLADILLAPAMMQLVGGLAGPKPLKIPNSSRS